ncbi:MAG: CHAT domain-containing protein [Spirochaetaceae bacterium]|nr:CHAT domain-containing protein [Spirochaetaceae bacterium]
MKSRKFLIAAISIIFIIHSYAFSQTADDAYSLFSKGNDCLYSYDYKNAIMYYEKAVPLYEKIYGKNNLYTADNYYLLGFSYSAIGNYNTAIIWLKKALSIYNSPNGDPKSTVNTLFEIGDAYHILQDYNNAITFYQKAIPFYEKEYGVNHIYLGTDYSLIGDCFSKIGKYDEAIVNLKKALEIFESPKIKSGKSASETKDDASRFASETVLGIGTAYEALGEYKNALFYFKKELSLNLKIYGDKHIKTSNAYRDVGYMDLHCCNFQEAIQEFTKAAEIRLFALGENSLEFAESLIDLAEAYTETENYTNALESLTKAEGIYNSLLKPNDIHFASLYQIFADYYRRTINLNQSLSYGYKAIAIFDENYGENNPASIAVYLAEIKNCYALMGDDSRVLAILLKCKDYYEKNSHQNLTNVLSSISDVYINKGDYTNAIVYCQEAIKTSKKYWGEKTIGMAGLYHSMGGIYVFKKEYETAISYYVKALDLYIELEQENSKQNLSLLASIASTFFQLDNYERAEFYETEVCKLANILGYTEIEASSYYSLGCLYHNPDFQNVKKSVECFKKYFELHKKSVFYENTINSAIKAFYLTAGLDSFSKESDFFNEMLSLVADTTERARLDMASVKSDILRETLPIYYYGVNFEAKNNNPSKAFEYSEMLRSRSFLDQIGLERAIALDGVTDSEREQIKKLTTQISSARKEIETQSSLSVNDRDSEKMSQAERDLSIAENALSKLDDKIAKRLPSYAQLRNPQTIKAKDAQKWCGNNRVILEYVIWNPGILENCEILKEPNTRECADDIKFSSYCIVMTNKSVIAVPLDNTYDYDAAVTKLRDGVIPKRLKPAPETVFEDVRNELYSKLIEPVLPYIKEQNQLVIVPDGSLSFLPFDILRKTEDSKMLCEQFGVALSPSVSISMIADSTRNKGLDMLAFGGAWYDTTLSIDEHRRTFVEQDSKRGRKRGVASDSNEITIENTLLIENPTDYFLQKQLKWKNLPGTITELNALKTKAVSKKKYTEYVQESASENTIKQLSKSGALLKYPILHFACHGYFDKDFPDMSCILFTEVSGKLADSSLDDGYLTIPEIATLHLDSDMVCLSACETGLGKFQSGDGMTGLSRAFMVAGSRHVGVTLWQVDDEATADFMTRMYKKIEKRGMTYEQAYRQTKAEFIKSDDYSHPYYWAAFVLYE